MNIVVPSTFTEVLSFGFSVTTVHFFVVKEDQVAQKPVPDPAGPAGIVDNSLVMDFAPNGVASGTLRFKVTDSGNYLVRVQSENTAAEHDHEHFSAIDLQVL